LRYIEVTLAATSSRLVPFDFAALLVRRASQLFSDTNLGLELLSVVEFYIV